MNNKQLDIAWLQPGDVLLCHKKDDYVAKKIEEKTGSKYCHAAIYYGDSLAAESLAFDGFKKGRIGKTNVSDLIARYDHVAVLRLHHGWGSTKRIDDLKQFIDKVINMGSRYNLCGIARFVKRKAFHESTLFKKLNEFFNGDFPPYSPVKSNYFCSEFVCDCFIAVGIIQPSAAVLYQSNVYAPGDLGNDATFGVFAGYLVKHSSHAIPTDDVFYNQSTYDEIYGS
ncbi:YiiX/YebB-like N1pC/P60 family cysteine hydrolase [Vibrio sp. CUB2]|uniref:YiiX/YebB-like N1pC/P60 family cysteine hydrolase n=1 Tax=Vibrio sp. CUB2 TaxID=2315233 RepID=UPI00076A1540|nr:YiiX/YebB-like N1pC/P60 family cysteine hydrolase [Vibrio sp. CUB2]